MKTKKTGLTEGQNLLVQAAEELDEYFYGDGKMLERKELVVAYAQTLAALELAKAVKGKP